MRKALRAVAKGARWARDAWAIIGVALVLMVGLEVGFRAQAWGRVHLRSAAAAASPKAAHPYAGEAWWSTWETLEIPMAVRHDYDPYRGWWPRRPIDLPALHVDSAGRRVTVGGAAIEGDRRVVLMLGGSTMWGLTTRDSATIPALVAAELHRRGLRDVEVMNLAQPAYNATQELITLMLELRRGERPAAVVFLDGNNEIATAFESEEAGRTFSEGRAARALDVGAGTLTDELLDLGRHSKLMQAVARSAGTPWVRDPEAPTEQVCGPVARDYANVVEMAETLGRRYAFSGLYLWQPMAATSPKPPSEWERSMRLLNTWEGYLELQRACTARVDSVMAERESVEFHRLDPLFAEDTASVFVDNFGHVTEAANATMASWIADRLAARLGATAPASEAATSQR